MGQNYFFGCISFNLKVIWPNLVRSEILDLGTLDLETAVKSECVFSAGGNVVTAKTTSLEPGKVEALVVINKIKLFFVLIRKI